MKKTGYIIFIIVCLGIILFPFVGMAVAPTNTTTENKTLTEFPELKTEEGINMNYLSDMGTYFQDHFAFRQQLVSANAAIYGKIFGASTTDQVFIGENNWMYYTGTLGDYKASQVMSGRSLQNAVHNLTLMQSYVESRGSKFILTIAPNKNSIYDENMPYYYNKGEADNNYDQLTALLKEAGVNYVDLMDAFQNNDEVLYLKRDSHWTNKGAALAFNQIMQQTDMDYETYENIPYDTRKDHLGDLTEMLYPLNSELENNQYYQKEWSYEYVNEVTDNMDEWIETSNTSESKTLLMYRDSFGESLLPFFADEFGKAYFSRLVPYNLTNVDQYKPDYTVVERVERRISSFAEEPPIMPAPTVKVGPAEKMETNTTLKVEASGGYYVISGIVDREFIQEASRIYIALSDGNGTITGYVPFQVTVADGDGENSDYGYQMYLRKDAVPEKEVVIEVLVGDGDQAASVKSQEVNLPE